MFVIESNCTSESLTLKRVISAPVDRVYQAWVEPQKLAKWFGCSQTKRVEAELDFRVGGKYTIKMFVELAEQNKDSDAELQSKEGGAKTACQSEGSAQQNCIVNTVKGEYLEIEPSRKIVFTWTNNFPEFPADNTLVTVQFKDLGGKTELTLTHSRFLSEKSVEAHSFGWTATLEKLAESDFAA